MSKSKTTTGREHAGTCADLTTRTTAHDMQPAHRGGRRCRRCGLFQRADGEYESGRTQPAGDGATP